jgi:hypothetical protein
MSVTFSPATPESVSIAHNLGCPCGAWVSSEVFPNYVSASKAGYAGVVKSACVDAYCLLDSAVLYPVPAVEFPELNLANGNAWGILSLLGLDGGDDLTGSISADKLVELVASALDNSPLTDYQERVLNSLRKIAEYSWVRSWEVSWG